jgi:hypothetical protein
MTHKTYIAMTTALAFALGSLSPALAEDAPMVEKAETATEATAKPAAAAPMVEKAEAATEATEKPAAAAPKDEKAETATEATEKPAGDAPDKAAE